MNKNKKCSKKTSKGKIVTYQVICVLYFCLVASLCLLVFLMLLVFFVLWCFWCMQNLFIKKKIKFKTVLIASFILLLTVNCFWFDRKLSINKFSVVPFLLVLAFYGCSTQVMFKHSKFKFNFVVLYYHIYHIFLLMMMINEYSYFLTVGNGSQIAYCAS